jgi:hypothetical protein
MIAQENTASYLGNNMEQEYHILVSERRLIEYAWTMSMGVKGA